MSLRAWAYAFKRDALSPWLAARDARTPRRARRLAGFVAAYAVSPIDLIPDFVPILGYVDDRFIVPAGIRLAVKLIPAPLLAELRAEAARRSERPSSARPRLPSSWFGSPPRRRSPG